MLQNFELWRLDFEIYNLESRIFYRTQLGNQVSRSLEMKFLRSRLKGCTTCFACKQCQSALAVWRRRIPGELITSLTNNGDLTRLDSLDFGKSCLWGLGKSRLNLGIAALHEEHCSPGNLRPSHRIRIKSKCRAKVWNLKRTKLKN